MKAKTNKIIFLSIIAGLLVSSFSLAITYIVKDLFVTSSIQYTEMANGELKINVENISCYELNIPSSVGGKKVTYIPSSGFKNCNINTIVLPETITTIEDKAFSNCKNLNKIRKQNKKETGIKIEGKTADELLFFTFNGNYYCDDKNINLSKHSFESTPFPTIGNISTIDNKVSTTFQITINNFNKFCNRIHYDISYCAETDIKSTGDITIDSESVKTNIDAKVNGKLKSSKFYLYQNDKEIYNFETDSIVATAPEYNFGIIPGNFPHLLFALECKEITKVGTLPTYIIFEADKYDFNNLMYNMHYLPVAKKATVIYHPEILYKRHLMSEYIKELHELNDSSMFNIICMDYNIDILFEMIYSNGIEDNKFTYRMLSEGSGISGTLNEFWGIKEGEEKFDCNAKFESITQNFLEAKKYFLSTRVWDRDKLKELFKYAIETDWSFGKYYAAVASMNYENISYHSGTLNKDQNLIDVKRNDETFCDKLISSFSIQNTNKLLNNLTDNEKLLFKKMYKFSDNIFERSRKSGKQIVVLMGSHWDKEKPDFYAYLKMTMEFYGVEKYDYYYKPHPGFPTTNIPERKQIFEKLKSEGYQIDELDSNIAAEIIMFFNPDIFSSGWTSSAFDSLQDNTKGLALYVKKSEAPLEYSYKFSVFFSQTSEAERTKYLGEEHKTDTNMYMIEYNNESGCSEEAKAKFALHDVGIYSVDDNLTRYWKNNYQDTGLTVEVDKDGLPINKGVYSYENVEQRY